MVNVSRTKPVMTLALLGIGIGVAYFAHKQGWLDSLLGKEKKEEEIPPPTNGTPSTNDKELEDIIANLEEEMGPPRPILPESGINRDLGGTGIISYQNAPTTFTGGYPTPVPTGAGLFPASAFYDPNYLSLLYSAQSHQQEQNPLTTVVDYFDPTTTPTAPPNTQQAAYAKSYMGARNFRHRRFGKIRDCAYKMDYDRGYIIKNSENKPPYYRPLTVANIH